MTRELATAIVAGVGAGAAVALYSVPFWPAVAGAYLAGGVCRAAFDPPWGDGRFHASALVHPLHPLSVWLGGAIVFAYTVALWPLVGRAARYERDYMAATCPPIPPEIAERLAREAEAERVATLRAIAAADAEAMAAVPRRGVD